MSMKKILLTLLLTAVISKLPAQFTWFKGSSSAYNWGRIAVLDSNLCTAAHFAITRKDLRNGHSECYGVPNLPVNPYNQFLSLYDPMIVPGKILINYYGNDSAGDNIGGIITYDSSGWKNFENPDFPNTWAPTVKLLENSNGDIWMADGNSMAFFDGITWTTYTCSSCTPNWFTDIAIDNSDTIWLVTNWGLSGGELFRFYNNTFQLMADFVCWNGFPQIFITKQNEIWIEGGGQGAETYYRFANGAIENMYSYNSDADIAFGEDMNGNLLVYQGIPGELLLFDGLTWHTITYPAQEGIEEIVSDDENNLWFSLVYNTFSIENKGLLRYDGTIWTYELPAYISWPDSNFTSLVFPPSPYATKYCDLLGGTPTGLASQSGGMNFYDSINSPISRNDVNCLAFKDSFLAIIGTDNGLLIWNIKNRAWSIFSADNSQLPNDTVNDILVESDLIWIATNNGIATFDGASTWAVYNSSNIPLPSDHVECIYNYDNIHYYGTDGGVAADSAGNWTLLTTLNSGLSNNHVKSIYRNPASIWFATYGGGVCDSTINGAWSYFNTSNFLSSDTVNIVSKGIDYPLTQIGGDVYAGSRGDGLVYFKNGNFNGTLNQVDNVPFSSVNDIVDHPNNNALGEMYFCTDKGIFMTFYYNYSVGIDDQDENFFSKVYFENDNLVIEINDPVNSDFKFDLTDLLGRTIFSQKITCKPGLPYSEKFRIGNLPGGIYIARILSGQNKYFNIKTFKRF